MRMLSPIRRGVGVAPGSITLKLGGLGEMIVAEEPGYYTTLECMPEYAVPGQWPDSQPAAAASMPAAPSRDVMYDPYTDIPSLRGLGRFNGIGTLPEYPTTIPISTLPPPSKITFAQRWQGYRMRQRGLRDVDTSAHIRWDLIAMVGGTSMIIAMMVGLFAAKK